MGAQVPMRAVSAAILAAVREVAPELLPDDLEVLVTSRRRGLIFHVTIPCERAVQAPHEPDEPDEDDEEEPFVPTAFQEAILEALEGTAMRSDALGAAVKDRGRLFRVPGGIQELREHGLVKHHRRLGYYRPDAPPPELSRDAG